MTATDFAPVGVPDLRHSLSDRASGEFRAHDANKLNSLNVEYELEASALSVARRLELIGEPFVFILAGGIFRAVPWLEQELERRLPISAPGSRVRLLEQEPAVGAVAIALQEARGGAVIPAYIN